VNVRIGTSGFSYDDWRGHFYPPALKKSEMLPFYARRFDTVEINSTYYGIPHPATMHQMSLKVPEGFEFVVKAHADMTHADRFRPEAFTQFREALAPLRDAGQLGAVLGQFPWSFKRTREHEAYLATFREELPDIPLVVEFRNVEWMADETLDLLRSLALGFCCVDEPKLKGLMPPIAAATAPVGYVRFHGRNYKKWWQHQHAWERYDYLYSASELEEWVPKIEQVARQTDKTYVFFNNHHEGQAAQNARQLADLLNLPLPPPEVQGELALQ
jgi:uncharacterized protein YecE (DUF72 family)